MSTLDRTEAKEIANVLLKEIEHMSDVKLPFYRAPIDDLVADALQAQHAAGVREGMQRAAKIAQAELSDDVGEEVAKAIRDAIPKENAK